MQLGQEKMDVSPDNTTLYFGGIDPGVKNLAQCVIDLEGNICNLSKINLVGNRNANLVSSTCVFDKLYEFLKQSKNMEDVLKVQSEINEIQEEMESASARINYLSHQSSFSTINLTFYQPLPGYVPTDLTPTFSYRIIDAFKTGLNFITEIFVGIISVWPMLLIVIAGWVLYKKRQVSLTASKQKLYV